MGTPSHAGSGAEDAAARTATGGVDPATPLGGMMARMRWPAGQLREYQRRRLTDLISHAVTASPYYCQVLGADAVSAPLEDLPTLPKSTLMDRFNDVVTDPALRLAGIRTHLAGPRAAQPYRDHLVVSTSGSTGTPAVFVYSRAEMAEAVAGLMRALAVLGAGPDTRVVGIGAPSAVSLSHHLIRGLPSGRASDAPHLSVITPIPDLVRELNAYQPEMMPTVASIASLLAEEQLAGRLRIAPRVVICTSEVLAADMRDRIRAAWGIEPHQLYATTEAAVMASTSPSQAGLHIWEDQVIIEVVDAAGDPAPAGTPGHKILITNLVNRVQPLIRYEISDTVTLASGADPAGWPFRRIASVDGRSDDVIMLSTPAGVQVPVHAMHLRAPFAAFPDVVQYQIVQDHAGLSVSVVLRPDAEPDQQTKVREALAGRLDATGVLPPPITVTVVPSIDRETGPLPKYAVVKSLLPGPEHQ
jgi:phenylacetate-coenzyme A ligase PaaK-like adenylate-forming protein